MTPKAQKYYLNKLKSLPDADDRIFERPGIKDVSAIKSVHIIGVCGIAMGSLAGLFKDDGYQVSGSDQGCYPPMSDMLEKLKIKVYQRFEPRPADAIIIGNAIRPDNPEAVFARENNLIQLSLPEAIKLFFLKNRRSLVVAGTHGKTTTSSLLVHVLEELGENPGYLIGGVIKNKDTGFALGSGKYFILEGDEYDTAYFDKSPKFLNYAADAAIITSIEFDHADIYENQEDYNQAFKFFTEQTDKIIGPNLKISNIRGQYFDWRHIKDIYLPLWGDYNISNAVAVLELCSAEGLDIERAAKALASFAGVKRRQEIIGEIKGITIIDDFAHHPTEVKATIIGIRNRFSDKRLIVFFEPCSNTSRRKLFEDDYGKSFAQADLVYIKSPPFRHNDKKDNFIDIEKVVKNIGDMAYAFSSVDELLNSALKELKENDIILIMSNSSFDGIQQKLLQRLNPARVPS